MPNNFVNQSARPSGLVVDVNTLMLMRFEGAQGSTVFTDDVGHVITNHGAPFIDNGVVLEGTSSGYFDGGSYLTVPGTDFAFTGDFTIELVFQLISFSGGSKMIMGTYTGNAQGHWMFEIIGSTSPIWYVNGAGTYVQGLVSYAINTTYKVALVRKAGTCTMYINGTAVGTPVAYAGTFGGAALPIGLGANPAGGSISNIRLDQVRISNIARYSADYTPA